MKINIKKVKQIILGFLFISSSFSSAQNFPYGFNYQAVARDANGNAKTNTQIGLKILIRIGNATTGTLIWEENHGPIMTNAMGQFSTTIGQGTRIAGTATLFSDIKWVDTTYFMDAQIQTGAFTFASIGTQRLMAVPYALAAPDPTPAGMIQAFAGSNAPAGYVVCDGRAVGRTGTYAKLFAAIGTAYGSGDGSTTFNIPDLRGMFLRGVTGASTNDPDAATRTASAPGGNVGNAIGSSQVDGLKSHSHTSNEATLKNGSAGGSTPSTLWFNGTSQASTSTSGGTETRPKNVYVNYIIKY